MTLILIDGISASGKSLLLKNLQSKIIKERENYTKIILTEHMTERYFENKNLDVATIHDHVARILNLILEIQKIQDDSPFKGNEKVVTAVIERLFLTLMSRNLLTSHFFTEHDQLIQSLKIKNIFLYIPPDLIEQRIQTSLGHRNEKWEEFILKLGGVKSACNYFNAQQENMKICNEILSQHINTEMFIIDTLKKFQDENFLKDIL